MRPVNERDAAMRRAAELGLDYLATLPERHVGARADAASVADRIGGPLPEHGTDATTVVEELAAAID